MKLKITGLCLVLMLGLIVSQADAQGYRVAVRTTSVVEGGNNQVLGAIRLSHRSIEQGGYNIAETGTITITFDGLQITNAAHIADVTNAATYLTAGGTFAGAVAVTAENDDDMVGKVTLTITGNPGTGADADTITVMNIRADVSGLMDGDEIMATISATAGDDEFSFVEPDDGVSSITGRVSTVRDGLMVTAVSQISQLTCDTHTTLMPSITVTEGFASAWETGAGQGFDATTNSTQIKITVANVPAGVALVWPGEDDYSLDHDGDDTTPNLTGDTSDPMDDQDRDGDADTPNPATVDVLNYVDDSATLADGTATVTYTFNGAAADGDNMAHGELTNSFTISPMVTIDIAGAGAGGIADVWAQLMPMADDNQATVLSYTSTPETMGNGYFLNISECVTYLLFPFLTCGATEGWTTGIAIANTSMDDMVFPVSDGAAPQSGPVTLYGFQRSAMTADGMSGMVPEMPMVHMVAENLAAGDTYSFSCDTMMPGFEGYAIVKAGFRYAHGTAFVLGNFQDGAAFDVSHGYLALVIPDPEFQNRGRAMNMGEESLGQ